MATKKQKEQKQQKQTEREDKDCQGVCMYYWTKDGWVVGSEGCSPPGNACHCPDPPGAPDPAPTAGEIVWAVMPCSGSKGKAARPMRVLYKKGHVSNVKGEEKP
jgi:hypothetical protein